LGAILDGFYAQDALMTLRRILAACLLLLSVTAVNLAAEPSPDVQEAVNRLASSIYTGPSMTTLRELSDGFGGRLTGSPSYNRAAEWAAAKFRSYGIQNVRLEPFTIPHGWVRGTADGQLLSPLPRSLYLESLGWAPSTPPGGIKGDAVIIDTVSPDSINAQADRIKGKIVFLDVAKIFAEGWVKVLPDVQASYALFKNAGAIAIIFPSGNKDNVLSATDPDWGGNLLPFPGAQIGYEDWQLIRRSLDKGPVTLQFDIQNTITGPVQVNNVVAEIRGSEKPDEWILIGAHLDSWDYGTGAQDNGSGSASVLEVARAITALGKAPRRSVRFALWAGEEEGLLGSFAYTQAHLGEMSKCVAVLNTDNGAGHPKGWKVQGRKDLKDAMQPFSDSTLKDLSGGELSMETTYDTDHGPFMLQGIPSLDLWVDMTHYFEVHHKPSDTYDKVDALDFKAGTAIVGVTAWAIVQDPKPIAPHLDHAAVADILKKAELEKLLAAIGHWKP
jgi:carboxypeptidase Q